MPPRPRQHAHRPVPTATGAQGGRRARVKLTEPPVVRGLAGGYAPYPASRLRTTMPSRKALATWRCLKLLWQMITAFIATARTTPRVLSYPACSPAAACIQAATSVGYLTATDTITMTGSRNPCWSFGAGRRAPA
jgi:hypothetical protein